jgi:hypothetical protein
MGALLLKLIIIVVVMAGVVIFIIVVILLLLQNQSLSQILRVLPCWLPVKICTDSTMVWSRVPFTYSS